VEYLALFPRPGNVFDALQPVLGGGGSGDVLLRPAFAHHLYSFRNGGELRVVCGSPSVSIFEEKLVQAEFSMDQVDLAKEVPGSVYHLSKITAHYYKSTHVLFDLSPAIGALNRTVVMSSDYLITPCLPEAFCVYGLQALVPTLLGNDWRCNWFARAYRNAQILRDPSSTYSVRYMAPLPRMRYLGAYLTRFMNKGDEKVKAYQFYTEKLARVLFGTLIPALSAVYPGDIGDYGNGKGLAHFDGAGPRSLVANPERDFLFSNRDLSSLMNCGMELSLPPQFICTADIRNHEQLSLNPTMAKNIVTFRSDLLKSARRLLELMDSPQLDVVVSDMVRTRGSDLMDRNPYLQKGRDVNTGGVIFVVDDDDE
jgi:hypothetical protein